MAVQLVPRGPDLHETNSMTTEAGDGSIGCNQPMICGRQLQLVMIASGCVRGSLSAREIGELRAALDQGVVPQSDLATIQAFLQDHTPQRGRPRR